MDARWRFARLKGWHRSKNWKERVWDYGRAELNLPGGTRIGGRAQVCEHHGIEEFDGVLERL